MDGGSSNGHRRRCTFIQVSILSAEWHRRASKIRFCPCDRHETLSLTFDVATCNIMKVNSKPHLGCIAFHVSQ